MIKNKHIKYVLIGLGVIAVVSLIIVGTSYYRFTQYQKGIEAISITGVDLSSVADGTYKGSYDAVLVSAEVDVTVVDHHIIDLDLTHNHDRGAAANVIPDHIVEQQKTNVDAVAGATNSSMVIMQAVENALKGQ